MKDRSASTKYQTGRLALAGTLLASIVMAVLSVPRSEFRGTLVETEIQRCQVERPKPGVVLDVTVLRSKSIYESRHFWNPGSLYTSPWRDERKRTETFDAEFGGNYCDTYPTGQHTWSLIRPGPPAGSGNRKLDFMPREFMPHIVAWTRD